MEKIVLVGAGGYCKVIIDIIRDNNAYEIIGITDKHIAEKALLDISIIGDDNKLKEIYKHGVKNAFLCIGALGNLNLRNKIYNNLKEIGFKLPVLIHNTAIVSNYATIGEGTCIMPGAIINSEAKIGENCIINTGAIIEHDCIIEDNCHISPRAVLGGGVSIEKNTHIGIGATVIQGLEVGSNVTIGAGAVVISSIPDNVVAFGIPSKIKKYK
ncbi:acetyltransferase [Clostridium botulinum]|uniref:Hexapeptide repeat-containing transferase n=2 Tax=Clostridium botulinum TaxID=1491 RepID=A7GGT9_CLOBL|nr:acetyltransferase [Clostridium botulinum]EKN42103.1 hexapeptide repeat-containing transferase [Clostridium botulinum CFSAN001627]ABS41833.1 hexapeptide repeat-containing transferase [Clostridium botulinum F str. Langeland]ADG00392.1 hexapeptide repeat-containing transferase [Clostridium botulinum F str. 230613]APC84461.1 sugar O-acyltransferase, sialic acid O-acetyltransferase NeuD family protein [Clostridium botulinum]AXG97626.1 serine acetyltransferase [Clostridium botulinum]